VNHVEFHRELSRKDDLFNNMQMLCSANLENVFDFLPVTFMLTIPDGKL